MNISCKTRKRLVSTAIDLLDNEATKNKASQILQNVVHMDAEEDGHWVTTKDGNHMFINGEGEPTKGNPHVLAAAKGESSSAKASTSEKTESNREGDRSLKQNKNFKRFVLKDGPLTMYDIKKTCDETLSPEKNEELVQDLMGVAYDNPERYYELLEYVPHNMRNRLNFELGPSNTNAIEEDIKPAIEKRKKELKAKIPSPKKNEATSGEFNGIKVTFYNARNAEYPTASRQQRFIDIRMEEPDGTISSYAANDYESAMEHVYRITGLRTKQSW